MLAVRLKLQRYLTPLLCYALSLSHVTVLRVLHPGLTTGNQMP